MAAGDDAPPIEFAGVAGVKYLFLEQRSPAGAEENEVTVTFQDVRTGMASWLADGGSGGAAEYLPANALVAGYVSMRQPGQLFQEFTALMSTRQPSFTGDLSKLEDTLGAGFVASLTAAMGTEAAFALHGFSASGPTWVMVGLANDPAVVDSSLTKLVETFNAELPPGEQDKRATLAQESAGGRMWTTLKAGGFPFGVTWTYDGGYLVAASDRGTAERAIATRNGGSALVWSPAFQSSTARFSRNPPVRVCLAEHEGRARDALGAVSEPVRERNAGRPRSGARGLRWTAGTDSCRQPYTFVGRDHRRNDARESGPDADSAALGNPAPLIL